MVVASRKQSCETEFEVREAEKDGVSHAVEVFLDNAEVLKHRGRAFGPRKWIGNDEK